MAIKRVTDTFDGQPEWEIPCACGDDRPEHDALYIELSCFSSAAVYLKTSGPGVWLSRADTRALGKLLLKIADPPKKARRGNK